MACKRKDPKKKAVVRRAKKKVHKHKQLRRKESPDSKNPIFMDDLSRCFHGIEMIHEYAAEHLCMSLKISQKRKEEEGFKFVREKKGAVTYMKRSHVRIALVHSNVDLYDSWVIAHSAKFGQLKKRFESNDAFELIADSHVLGEMSIKYMHIRTKNIVKIVSRKWPIFRGIRSR